VCNILNYRTQTEVLAWVIGGRLPAAGDGGSGGSPEAGSCCIFVPAGRDFLRSGQEHEARISRDGVLGAVDRSEGGRQSRGAGE